LRRYDFEGEFYDAQGTAKDIILLEREEQEGLKDGVRGLLKVSSTFEVGGR
jgi:hypothetical protein